MSLASFFAARGLSLSQAARQIGVAVELLERVDQQRQPLSIDVARVISHAFGVDVGTVLGEAKLWVDSTAPIYRVPVPPDPSSFGDVLRSTPILGTGQIPPVGAAVATGVWASAVFAAPPEATPNGLKHFDRNTGEVLSTVSFTFVNNPGEVVVDSERMLWTVAQDVSGGLYYTAKVNPRSGAIDISRPDVQLSAPRHLLFEPASTTLWVANSTGDLGRIDLALGLTSATVNLGVGVHPQHMVAVDGKLYVVGCSGSAGRLYEVNPVSLAILRTSTGVAFGAGATGLAFDPISDAFYIADPTTPSAGAVFKVPRSTFVASSLAITGGSASIGATEVIAAKGLLFFCDSDTEGAGTVVRATHVDGTVIAELHQGHGAALHAVFDGAWVWVSCSERLFKLNAEDLRLLLTVPNTGGLSFRGLAVL